MRRGSLGVLDGALCPSHHLEREVGGDILEKRVRSREDGCERGKVDGVEREGGCERGRVDEVDELWLWSTRSG